MKKLFILLFSSLLFAGEMEVDGNLTVTDTLHVTTIQSATLDSLLSLIAQLEQRIAQLECQNTGIIPDGYCDCFFHILDACGVCNGDTTSCQDCAGVVNGDNLQDMCGTCDNDSSNDCVQDCNGEWGGTAEEDICGVCGGDAISEDDCGDYALSFNGEDEWIEFYAGIIPSEGDFTVELWTYHNDTNESHIEILSQGTSGNAFYIGRNENNNFRIGDSWQTTNVNFPFGGYYNITVVRESNNTHLFFDGNLVQSKGSTIPNPNEENYFKIGMQYSQGEYWNGYIDEVRISNSARYTSDFIPQDRFESDANTLALWHFDPNPDNLLIDSSPNGNHGTLKNMDGSNWVERE